MKKLILFLFGLSLSVMSASAMTLGDAYKALSNLPNVSRAVDDVFTSSIIKTAKYDATMQVSRAVGLDSTEILKTGNATYAILNQIPLTYMINGGNNGYVGAFIYSTPNENGTNDLLVVTMSGGQGDVTYLYVTNVEERDKTALVNAELTMQGSSLLIVPLSDCFLSIKLNS